MPVLDQPVVLTPQMKDALKRQILYLRKRKEEEEAQTFALERERKEREQKKKQDSLTLEQTKEQVSILEKKLEELREEKHRLFTQLKKVLNQEDEQKRRQEITPKNDVTLPQTLGSNMSPSACLSTAVAVSKTSGFAGAQVKRHRSPSPPNGSPRLTQFSQQQLFVAKVPTPTYQSTQYAPHTPSSVLQPPFVPHKSETYKSQGYSSFGGVQNSVQPALPRQFNPVVGGSSMLSTSPRPPSGTIASGSAFTMNKVVASTHSVTGRAAVVPKHQGVPSFSGVPPKS